MFVDFWRKGVSGVHIGQRLECQIGVDRFGAVSGQNRKMMDLTRFRRFDHQPDRSAQALLDQVMMHRRRCQQRRDSNTLLAELAVRQDDDVVTALH